MSKEPIEKFLKLKIENGAKICFLHFSARNSPLGKFNEYPTPAGNSNIYLNPGDKNWYINGLPCFDGGFDETLQILQEVIESSGAKKIICIGSSMGAFGASLIACHLQGDLICFAPELSLNIYSGFSKSDNLTGYLPRLEDLNSPRRALIFAGVNSPSDVVCAEFFKNYWPDCKSYLFGNCGHGSAKYLKNHGLLERVIENFVQNIDLTPMLSPLLTHNETLFDFKFVEPRQFSEDHLISYINAVYTKTKLVNAVEIATHLRSRGAFSASLALVERLIDDHGPLSEFVLLKAQCLRRLRRDNDAIDMFSILQNNQYYRNQAILGLGLVYKRLGRVQEVHDSYSKLVNFVKKDLELYSSFLNDSRVEISKIDSAAQNSLSVNFDGIELTNAESRSVGLFHKNITELEYVDIIGDSLKALNYDVAKQMASEGLKFFPVSKIIQSQFACISQQEKDWPTTIERLLKLLAMEGENPSAETYSRLVQAYRNTKNYISADSFAIEGLAAFPGNLAIQSEFAWNAQTQKNWPIAVERLEMLFAFQGAGAIDKTYVRLAQAYRGVGREMDAEALLIEGDRKFPNSSKIKSEYANYSSKNNQNNISVCVNETKNIDDSVVNIDILLTTFPGHKSKNVGDNLICHSALKMLKARRPDFNPVTIFREENLDHYADGTVRNIIAPGFSVSDGVYPKLFGLYTDLERLPDFFPIGCSFQHTIPSYDSFLNYQYEESTLKFLRFLTEKSGALPCRDQLIVDMLRRHDIPAVYSGDLAMYDESIVNTAFSPPEQIRSVVFTIQHHERYFNQSLDLLELIKDRFPNAKLYVAFHSKAGPAPQRVADHAVSLGFSELHLYGDVNNLVIYDEIDLHVGYRLHGHISFLRRRKPSILMVEDARSFGLAHTQGTEAGCFEALSLSNHEADMSAPSCAMKFLDVQIDDNFSDYQQLFKFVDKTYNEFISPFFDNLARRVI